MQEIDRGVNMVLNLAAGLDSRPYRLPPPSTLKWLEVDLSDVIEYKRRVLADELPNCALTRVSLDLLNVDDRRALFGSLQSDAETVLIVSEGYFIYLSDVEVGSLARDLAGPTNFQRLVVDLASPTLLRVLQRRIGSRLTSPREVLKFGPEQGPSFFVPHGWRPVVGPTNKNHVNGATGPLRIVSGVYTFARNL